MSRAGVGVLAALPVVARVCAHTAAERVRPVGDGDPARVPTAPGRVGTGWLTAALCADVPGARVLAVRAGEGSSGTTWRRVLHLDYNEAGTAAGLPRSVFAKASPTLRQRITQAITGPVEPEFYTRLRPQLEIEAPICFHGVVDRRRMTSLMLLQDLVAEKDATFLTPTTTVTREMAHEVVRMLATVHGTFWGRPRPAFAKTYVQHWRDALDLVDVERYFTRCFAEASEHLTSGVRDEPRRAWRAVLASIAAHDAAPATLLHNDVHLGNWYRTGDGRMGLCDWQAVVHGSWARDVAYAVTTTLAVEDRRAWERELLDLYRERLAAAGGPTLDPEQAWLDYRRQVWGALAYWAPTFSPPRLMPADMQPRAVSGKLLHRITTACDDLDAFAAAGV
ncbi:phosphotransferase family protein [Paraconexibacter sp.]|uniref:phosphotransferase family protein n=1 Tax=Paraconexibacter sp. TaxID=2949640 RepID=UPI0035690208